MKVEILKQNGYHFLWIDGELWMWDLPEEVLIQRELADKAFGSVLVVGHGLGIVQDFLSKNRKVKEIETVEIYEEVRDAYFGCYNKHIPGRIIIDDFYNLPNPSYQRWDCIIGDICFEIHPRYLPEYKKFRQHALTLLNSRGKILAWGQEFFDELLCREGSKEAPALQESVS